MLAGRVLSPDTSGEGFQAQSRNPMYGLAPYIAGGLAAVLMVDHLAMPSIGSAVTAVEVVGLRNTAVVYRDREGRVLFRTDPVSNATLVAKDVVLPEITIRDSGRSTVNPVPIEVPARAPERPKLPPGCDSAFSPLTLPSLSRMPSRCIAENERPARLAGL